MRQRILAGVISSFLLCVLASAGAAGSGHYQTIPAAPSIYLPLILRQDLPTPTVTQTALATATVTAIATVTQTVAPTITPTLTPTRRANCDASYPTVCIPSPPPDLDCRDILPRRFTVLSPDPHNFDSDHDGIGCESD